MTQALHAIAPGPYVTVQDAGRRGWRRFGVACSGAMDMPALAMANALVGNPPDTAALEFAHVGGTWEVMAQSVRVAVTGGSFVVEADGVALAPWRSHTLRHGQLLSIMGTADAVWGYLAVADGFDLEPQLGSVSTHLRSGIGGLDGTRIASGDALPLCSAAAPEGQERHMSPRARGTGPLRVVLGPQDDYFAVKTIVEFLSSSYRVTHRSDRMGTWLDGPPLAHADGFNIISDGLGPGCIQVPGVGRPVVLMMDCQTIGGYPKIATIITPDLPRFAQARPGTLVNFAAIGIEAAQQLYRAHQAALAALPETVHEVGDRSTRPFWLLG